ncbi:MAG: hypothetical protein RL701_4645 [Pseudomonadota bacterium]|jgi:sigma-B regulation protein RsbU (phosphoserine phosphatase)
MSAEKNSLEAAIVLIVDDTKVMLDMYARILEVAGYRVYAVDSGAAALRALETCVPELIILDSMMPEMNGLELLERIRCEPTLKMTPVVFLTASGDDEDSVARAFAMGANDYLQKPINRRIFCSRVASLITQERQRLSVSASAGMEDERMRVVEELERARVLQHSQLPLTPSVRDNWRIVGALRSCNEVGGDLFDIIDSPSGIRTLAVVDVSGHGLSAALVCASVRGMLRLLLRSHPIDVVMRELNAQLCAASNEHYACVGLIQFHPTGLHVVNAGLPPIVVQTRTDILRIAASGMPPGLFDDATYELNMIQDVSPMRVISATDGLTEPFGASDDTETYLSALGLNDPDVAVESGAALDAKLEKLFASRELRQPDDATVVVADRR